MKDYPTEAFRFLANYMKLFNFLPILEAVNFSDDFPDFYWLESTTGQVNLEKSVSEVQPTQGKIRHLSRILRSTPTSKE